MPKTFEVSNIKYDTDGEEVDLPTTLTIIVPDDVEFDDIEEFISDEISNVTGFCHEGFATTPEIDLFNDYENLPQEVQDVLDKYCDGNNSYDKCGKLVDELHTIGYTCEYGLSAEPYGLRKIN